MILTSAILAVAIAGVAGAFIRFWAFAVFALLVGIGFTMMFFFQTASLSRSLLWGVALLFVMEASYVLGVLIIGLWRRSRRLSGAKVMAEPARAAEEHHHH